MKKILISMLFVFVMILSGCSLNQSNEKEEQNNVKDEGKTDKWKDLYDWEMRSTSNN